MPPLYNSSPVCLNCDMYICKLKGCVCYRDITTSTNTTHTPKAVTLSRSTAGQIMAGAEPFNEEGSPPHREAQKSSKARGGG